MSVNYMPEIPQSLSISGHGGDVYFEGSGGRVGIDSWSISDRVVTVDGVPLSIGLTRIELRSDDHSSLQCFR